MTDRTAFETAMAGTREAEREAMAAFDRAATMLGGIVGRDAIWSPQYAWLLRNERVAPALAALDAVFARENDRYPSMPSASTARFKGGTMEPVYPVGSAVKAAAKFRAMAARIHRACDRAAAEMTAVAEAVERECA